MALWFRAAERIEVETEGVVPGPPAVEPLPNRSTDPSDAVELAEGWLTWWRSLVNAGPLTLPFDLSNPPVALSFTPPAFSGLHDWPALRQVVTERWMEAHQWHTARMRAGLEAGPHHDMRASQVVTEVERALGRRARPFALNLVLLPVCDEEIRLAGPNRYLVPERVYDGPRGLELLRSLVTPIA
ncbi:hypothetical protein [Sphaerisporangium dianthi]